jgi:hypothetical protein
MGRDWVAISTAWPSVPPKQQACHSPVRVSTLRGKRCLLTIDVQIVFCETVNDWDCFYHLFWPTTIGLSPSRVCNFPLLSQYWYLQLLSLTLDNTAHVLLLTHSPPQFPSTPATQKQRFIHESRDKANNYCSITLRLCTELGISTRSPSEKIWSAYNLLWQNIYGRKF